MLLDFYGALLSEKQRKSLTLYYNDDLSLSEVAQELNITRQGVHNLINRSGDMLFDYEEKLGLLKRFNRLTDGLGDIKSKAIDIKAITDDSRVKSLANEIENISDKLSQEEE